ncbi:MAG TPA: hypothetical protein VFW39_08555 [Sphingomicrobium sp.]|nr:hypothetical protein [Sphingomicrobium sp.]
MKRLFALLILALVGTFAASAACAQSDMAQRYAACLAQVRPTEVHDLLQATSADAASMRYHALSDDDRCFGRVFGDKQFRPQDASFSVDVLRGDLAEQELEAQAERVAALQPLPLQQKRYIRPWFAATGRNPAVDEMGACMADTDPAGIIGLIRTTPGTTDESNAISGMSTALTKCLSAGMRLDASRGALRAALADALYQRLSNPALSLAQVLPASK